VNIESLIISISQSFIRFFTVLIKIECVSETMTNNIFNGSFIKQAKEILLLDN